MKAITKLASLLLCTIMSITLLSACSIFSNQPDDSGSGDGGDNPQPNTQTIRVYNGDNFTNYTVTIGEVAKIDIFTKPEYYFAGAYDSPEGGTKYFDGNGNSLTIWGPGMPETYYVHFEPVSTLEFYQILRDEEPYEGGGAPEWFEFTLGPEMVCAIKGNPNMNMYITISFVAKSGGSSCTLNTLYLTGMKSGGERHNCIGNNDEVLVINNVYQTHKYRFKITAKEFKNGNVYLCVQKKLSIGYTSYYIKNIELQMSFANINEEN